MPDEKKVEVRYFFESLHVRVRSVCVSVYVYVCVCKL